MEFRSCPSCKASVLEDDVEDCPFCGASMSGKPSAAPPKPAARPAPRPSAAGTSRPAATGAPAPAQRPASPSRSATSPGPVRARVDAEEEHASDTSDPFEVDPLAHKQATAVAIKPGKGRTVEVKCPMCETIGYISQAQAGKDVKCCNPSCKLPIFKAPKLPPVVKAEPEKPKGMSVATISAIAVVGIAVVAGALWWFVLRTDPRPKPTETSTPTTPVENSPDLGSTANVVVIPQKHVVSTIEEISQRSLQEILEVTIRSEFRSKPFGRQLAAQALLTAGDLAGAQEQISKVGTGGQQYAIEPLALLAQKKLDVGDKAGAEALLQEAEKNADRHPDILRSHLDAVVVLAATLVRLDRTPDAVELLNKFEKHDVDVRAALSEIWRASIDQGTFAFARERSLSHLELCGQPLWVAATIDLCHQRQWEKALAWSRVAPEAVTRDASLAACAGMMTSRLVTKSDAALASQLKAAIDAADLTAQVRMQVAAAEVRFMLKDKSVTAAQVAEIELLLGQVKIPAPTPAPSMRAIHDSKGTPHGGLPDPGPGTSLALAFADIANLKMKLGDTAGGWANQMQAMEVLRSVSPSPALMRAMFERSTKGTEIAQQLGQELGLGSDENKKRRALSQYRAQCEEVLKIANARFAIQQALLRRSISFGLLADVWTFIQDFDHVEESRREPYRSDVGLVVEFYYSALAMGKQEVLQQKWGEFTPREQQAIRAAENTYGALAKSTLETASGNFQNAADVLKPLYVKTLMDRNLVDRHILTLANQLAEKSVTDCYTFVQRLFEPTIREDAMHLLAGWAIRNEKGPELWKLIEADRDLPSTDRATTYLGFLEGIRAMNAK